MTGSEEIDTHALSAQGFFRYAEAWATESADDVSLSKYSILLVLEQPINLLEQPSRSNGVGIALYLYAAALKREYVGASRFILWSFANARSPRELELERLKNMDMAYRTSYGSPSKPSKKPIQGIELPISERFQSWREKKSSGPQLKVPSWELPLLADYADDFQALVHHLDSVCDEFDSTFLKDAGHGQSVSLAKVLDESIYFQRKKELASLALEVMERAVAEHHENPVDLLLQAVERIGLVTRRTLHSEDVAKSERSDSKEAQQPEHKSEERSQSE